MATVPTRGLKAGKIIDKTLAVIERNAAPAAIYVLIMTAACVPVSYFAIGSMDPMRLMGGEILKAAIGIVAAYFLLVAMLRRTGLYSRTDGDSFFPYVGLSLLYTLGVMLGMIVLILPGLWVMARWSIAQSLLVGRGDGVMASLGESWDRTKDKEFQILGAALALVVLLIAVVIAAGAFFEEGDLVGITVSQLASSGIGLVLIAWNVAIYGLIVGAETAAAPSS